MSGCPFNEYNWKQDCEVCTCTNKPTNGAVMCDFGYDEECATFQANTNKDE